MRRSPGPKSPEGPVQERGSAVPRGASSGLLGAFVRAAWSSKGQLGWGLDVLRHGVCGDCALGTVGWRDELRPGLHLCSRRAAGLRRWTRGALNPALLPPVTELRGLSAEELRSLGRLPVPLLWRCDRPGFVPLDWDDALKLGSERLGQSAGRWALGVEASLPSNEGIYALAQLVRSRSPRRVGLLERGSFRAVSSAMEQVLGSDAATCSLSDLASADCIALWGSALGEEPLISQHLAAARNRGARILDLSGLPAEQSALAAWVMAAWLATSGALDRAFLERRCSGGASFRSRLQSESRIIGEGGGRGREELEGWAEQLSASDSTVFLVGAGLGAGEQGRAAAEAVLALSLLLGLPGRPGSGLVPVGWPAGYRAVRDLGLLLEAEPAEFSLDSNVSNSADQSVDFLYLVGWGGEDSTLSEEDLSGVSFRIHQAVDLDPSVLCSATEAVLLLPMQSRFEQEGGATFTSSDRRVRFSPEIRGHRIGESRPDWWIPQRFMQAGSEPSWDDGDALRRALAREESAYKPIARLFAAGDSFQWGGSSPWSDRFPTEDGKARLPPVPSLSQPQTLGPASDSEAKGA